MNDFLLYLLYAFVQGVVIVRCTVSRKAIMKNGAGGELLAYVVCAPIITIFVAAYCFALFVRWLLVVGRKE